MSAGPSTSDRTAATRQVDNLSLDKYIPLGVVSSPIPTGSPYPDSEVWSELEQWAPSGWDFEIVVDNSTVRVDFVFTLIRAKWVRIFHGKDHKRPDLACLRVYVLPEDVARREAEPALGGHDLRGAGH